MDDVANISVMQNSIPIFVHHARCFTARRRIFDPGMFPVTEVHAPSTFVCACSMVRDAELVFECSSVAVHTKALDSHAVLRTGSSTHLPAITAREPRDHPVGPRKASAQLVVDATDSCRSVPSTASPPRPSHLAQYDVDATAGHIGSHFCTAPGRPASEMMAASRSCCFALRRDARSPRAQWRDSSLVSFVRGSAVIKTGCPFAALRRSPSPCIFKCGNTRSGWVLRTIGWCAGIATTSSP